MHDQNQKQIDDLTRKLDRIEASLNSTRKELNRFINDHLRVDYTQVDGIVGTYDGYVMTTEAGEKYEVPANYAAKTKLVFGDILKLIEEDGKKLFKQIGRANREKVHGILTKKEGEWYLLTDRGSYKVSDVAAEYQGAALNSETTAFLPADNLDAPFATIDVVQGFGNAKKTKPGAEEAPKAKKPAAKPDKAPVKKAEKAEEPAVEAPPQASVEPKEEKEEKPAPAKKAPAKKPAARKTCCQKASG